MTAAPATADVAVPQTAARGALELFWLRFREDKAALFGAATIGLLIVIAAIGGLQEPLREARYGIRIELGQPIDPAALVDLYLRGVGPRQERA